MDIIFDIDLFWIAEDLLLSDIPDGWEKFTDKEEKPYYYDVSGMAFSTPYYAQHVFSFADSLSLLLQTVRKVTTWSHPMEEYYRGVYFMHKEGEIRTKQRELEKPPKPGE